MDELKKIRQAGLVSISEELGKTEKGKADASPETPEEAYIPKLKFDDIAGLENVKETVKYRAIMPVQYADVYKLFNKSQGGGILLYGLPGTGKTMIAKATALTAQTLNSFAKRRRKLQLKGLLNAAGESVYCVRILITRCHR